MTTRTEAHVDGDELHAKNDVRLGGLELMRVAPDDPAQHRIGLPLGLIVSLLKNRRGEIDFPLPVGGRLSDPQFDVHEAIWSGMRTIALKTIALPVSWIGRLHIGRNSRIERIEIDPVPFEVGSATVTSGGSVQVERLAGFLRQSPAVRMVLTPAVTLGDVDRLKADAVRTAIRNVSKERRLSEAEAAVRVYSEHFPGREPPGTVDAIVAAVSEDEPPPEREAAQLAIDRANAVRDALGTAGIDRARLARSSGR